MVAIVTSNGAGLVNSSKDVLGAAGELGNSATGRAGERLTVNAATGNLVIQDRDEYLVGVGPDVDLLRTYNSVGGWDGDNGDGWRLGYYRRVSGLTGTVNTSGSSIRRVEADGSESVYIHNGTRYVCSDGAGQYDTLSFDGANWTWIDGDTGVKELYEAFGAGNYRLRQLTDPDGNFVKVDYGATGLISTLGTYKAGATVASETLALSYVGTELQKVITSYLDAQGQARTRSVTSYTYLNGRLDTVTTDLSPEDGSISDGKVYTVRYGYDGSGRLTSIQQTDGTQITIGYEPGTGRVASVLDGRGLGSTFTYDASGTTTVKDALGQATTLKYGSKGELMEVSGAVTGGGSFIQKYGYSPAGDLLTSTNAKNETTTYEYNGTGALLRRTDAAGNVLERSYTAEGLVASETLYLVPDPDGVAGAGKASAPLTTNYYYDTTAGRRRLQYVIYGDGSLASYAYDNLLGQLTDTFQYSPDVVFSGNRQSASEVSAFAINAFKTDKGIVCNHHEYDLRGLLAKERSYASSSYNATTNGLDFVDATDTVYTYDPSGRLLTRQDASGVKLSYEYDGLGRVTKSWDGGNVATIYSYSDTDRETRVKLDNGQTTVQVFNRWGDLISSDVLGAGNTLANLKKLGETRYSYDNLGRLWRSSDATGVSVYSLYDVSGRKSADIAANGQLTEYLYDAAGRLIQQIAYATPLLKATLDGLTATSTVAGVRPAQSTADDRITTYYYDAAARLTGVLDADGYLTQTRYDGTGAVTSQTTYANAVTVNRLDVTLGTTRSGAPNQSSPIQDAARDRTVRSLYDAARRLVAQVDGDGGLTGWTYDATGNRRSQLRRSLALTDSQRTSADLAALSALTPLVDDEFTQWLYDGHGRQIAQLSAEGYLTETTYDAAGRLKDTLQYLTQAFKPVVTGSPNTLRWLLRSELNTLRASLGVALKTSRSYNSRGLLERETSVDGTVVFYQYDNLQRLTSTTRAEGWTEQRVGLVGYDDWGRLQTTKIQGDASGITFTYDAAGRRTSSKDARGNTTFYYYDAQGRQVYAILRDPVVGGEVTETIYSAFSEVQATVTHAARLSVSDCAALTGGQADAARLSRAPAADIPLANAIAALGNTSIDNRSSVAYNRRGLIQQAVDALGYKTDSSYNAFGELDTRIVDVDALRRLTTVYSYDRRGLSAKQTRTSGALSSSVQRQDDALGRLKTLTNELNKVTTYEYLRDTGSGRKLRVTDPAGVTTTTYDAIDRVVARADRNGNTVTYVHDAVNRKLTLKTAEGIQTVTETTRLGQTYKITDGTGAVTTYAYDTHGNLLTVTDALGSVTKNSYDLNDNLVQAIQGLKSNGAAAPTNDGSATTTSYSFDAANRVLTQTVDPDGLKLKTSYEYDGQGRRVKITDAAGTVTTQSFTSKGELSEVIVDAGGLNLKTTYQYDAQSRTLETVQGAGTAAAIKTRIEFDALGRRTAHIVDPDGVKLKNSFEYDAAGQLLVQRNNLSQVVGRYRYDDAGRLLFSVDATGAVTRNFYDGEAHLTGSLVFAQHLDTGWEGKTETEFGTLLSALVPGASDILQSNVYDRDGRLSFVIDALGGVTDMQYDNAGRLLAQRRYANRVAIGQAPDSLVSLRAKLVRNDAADQLTRYAYDAVGNQRFIIDERGYITEKKFDRLGRLLQTTQYATPEATQESFNTTATSLSNWFVYSSTGGAETITRVFDAERNEQVIALSGNGKSTGYYLSCNAVRNNWDSEGTVISWDMKYAESFSVYVSLTTSEGHRYIEYQPGTSGPRGTTGEYVQYYFPGAADGQWHRIMRDLRADLAALQPDVEILSLDALLVRGSGRIGDVIVSRPDAPPTLIGVQSRVVTSASDRTTKLVYDAAGRQRFLVDAEGYVTETRYDDQASKITSLRYAGRTSGATPYSPSSTALTLASFTGTDAAAVAVRANLGIAVSVTRTLDKAGRLSVETDGNGIETKFGYDAAGHLETEVRANNIAGQPSATRYRYNSAGQRTEVVRGDGTAQASTQRYEYDSFGRLWHEIDARGVALAEGTGAWERAERVRRGFAEDLSTLSPTARASVQAVLRAAFTTTYEYDANDRLKQTTDALGGVTTTDFDTFGNVSVITDARGYKRYQTFDKRGQLLQSVDAERYLTVYAYDAFGNLQSTLRVDARVQGSLVAGQAVTLVNTPPSSGAYVLISTALDHRTSWEYDRSNRLLRETDAENYVEGAVGALSAFGERTAARNKLGANVSYTYDRLGRVLTETLPVQAKDGSGVLKDVVNEYQYDSRGNRIVSIEAKGLPEQHTTQMRYDGAGRLTMRIGMAYAVLNADNSTSTVTPADTYRYDARGNLIEVISHGQLQANGSVTGGRRTVSYFDALDRQTLQIGADRVVTRSSYDVARNLVEQTAYATRLADAVVIDPVGAAPTISTDAANDRTYFHRYDELGRRVQTALAKLYAWDSGLTGANLVISGLTAQPVVLQTFFYDKAGNLTEVQNGRGYSSYSYYDGLGRKTLSIDAGGAASAWDYGRAGGVATRETRYSGMLTGGYARQADALVGLNSSNSPAALLTAIQGLSTHVIGDDRITEVDLDRLDRVTEKRVLKVAQDLIDASGKRTKSITTATTRYGYDGLGHVTQLKELAAEIGADQTWEVSDISYDKLGREIQRRGVAFTDWQNNSVRPTTDVEYNGLGDVARRLLRGNDNSVETDDRITRYAYDANGVLTRSTDASGAVTQYDYDDQGGLVRRTSLGVLRSDGTSRNLVHRYTLDAAGRIASETTFESDKPVQAETRKTRYNAFGEISAKGIGDGWEEFFEYSTLGKIVKTNTGDGAIKFYIYDAAGNQTREIKGNGDVSVDLKAMTLTEASASVKLFSRVSIYDRRSLIIQTIDPQIELLKNTVSMSALYGQAWVPALQISNPRLIEASILPNASVTITSGSRPTLYLTHSGSGSGYVSSTAAGVFSAETANTVGQPMAVDLSSLKGLGRYTLIYITNNSGAGPWPADSLPLTKGRIDITVAADGNVSYSLLPSLDEDRCPAYVKFPPDSSRPGTWMDYSISIEVDGAYAGSGVYSSFANVNWPNACWAAVPVGQYRPAYGSRSIVLHYSAGASISGTVRVLIDSAGRLYPQENNADQAPLPVKFSILGRKIDWAWITGTNRRTGERFNGQVAGSYVVGDASNPGGTIFTWDLKGYLAQGDEMDYTLEPVGANNAAKLDESGDALVQTGRIVIANGAPVVLKQVITLDTGDKVTIKRFQDFNAFGEVSEERDERVGERMLAAINDERAQKGLSALTALTAEQQAATRTTLKYNTLGQLVSKLDPETFVTAENGYRYRARPETKYGYDLLGRLTTMQDANGNLSRVQYLAGSRGSDASVLREFDAAGDNADVFNVTGGGIRLTEYDVFGDSRRFTEAQGSSEQRVTERAYDERGLLKTVIRKGVQRLVNGTSETVDAARDLTETYTYDALGQRLKATNALNFTSRTDYDALGRVVQTVSGNNFITSYSYSLRVVGQADGIKGLAGASSGGYVLTTLRADGRSLTDKIDYFGHATWHKDLAGTEFTYSFNSAGQLITQTSTLGQEIAYSYYANGYIRAFEDRYQGILSQYSYDNAGNRVYEGIFTTTTRDAQGALVIAPGATAFQSGTIIYDELNRISRVRDPNFFDVRYEFDAVGNRRRIYSVYSDGLEGLRAKQDLNRPGNRGGPLG